MTGRRRRRDFGWRLGGGSLCGRRRWSDGDDGEEAVLTGAAGVVCDGEAAQEKVV